VSRSEAPSPIRTLVCDDERRARRAFVTLLADDRELAIVGEASDGIEAADLIQRTAPDLVFLDVEMPHLDGFGVLRTLVAPRPTIVFITAHDEYAVRAFEVHAVDYLVKPIERDRLTRALAVAKSRVRQRRVCELSERLAALLPAGRDGAPRGGTPDDGDDAPRPPRRYVERIPVRIGRSLTYVPVAEIDWIEADDYYARLHAGGRAYVVRQTMRDLEAKLDPLMFVRVHRSAIVRIDHVDRMHPCVRGAHVLSLKDGIRLTLSRSRRAAFEAALGGVR
jgi:two-component system LytT family response regulator